MLLTGFAPRNRRAELTRGRRPVTSSCDSSDTVAGTRSGASAWTPRCSFGPCAEPDAERHRSVRDQSVQLDHVGYERRSSRSEHARGCVQWAAGGAETVWTS